jgi:protein-S-isoprenylcysteine O-methyltransferase Ste14|tara:strand:- start:2 stop:496 length:495 start_codon:yes stop_codon:yes gene_type:complete
MTDSTPDPIDGADMPLPPAIYPLICVGGGYFLNKYIPLTAPAFLTTDAAINDKLAAVVLISSLLLIAWSIFTLRRNETTLLPHRAVSRLVTSGPFQYSRNPIYLGFSLLLLAMFFSTLNVWLVILLPLNLWLLQHYVILPEEKHLKERFEADFQDYQSLVRRWL